MSSFNDDQENEKRLDEVVLSFWTNYNDYVPTETVDDDKKDHYYREINGTLQKIKNLILKQYTWIPPYLNILECQSRK